VSAPKRGRPPVPPAERRARQVPVRLTDAEHARYETAAAATGTTLADEARKAWERMARRAAK
jgi:hypothetical protein